LCAAKNGILEYDFGFWLGFDAMVTANNERTDSRFGLSCTVTIKSPGHRHHGRKWVISEDMRGKYGLCCQWLREKGCFVGSYGSYGDNRSPYFMVPDDVYIGSVIHLVLEHARRRTSIFPGRIKEAEDAVRGILQARYAERKPDLYRALRVSLASANSLIYQLLLRLTYGEVYEAVHQVSVGMKCSKQLADLAKLIEVVRGGALTPAGMQVMEHYFTRVLPAVRVGVGLGHATGSQRMAKHAVRNNSILIHDIKQARQLLSAAGVRAAPGAGGGGGRR
jgi:hypothetical protein